MVAGPAQRGGGKTRMVHACRATRWRRRDARRCCGTRWHRPCRRARLRDRPMRLRGWICAWAVASAGAHAAVPAPALKWAWGGCFASWCQAGRYGSPAALDLDGDGPPRGAGRPLRPRRARRHRWFAALARRRRRAGMAGHRGRRPRPRRRAHRHPLRDHVRPQWPATARPADVRLQQRRPCTQDPGRGRHACRPRDRPAR